MDTNKSGWIAWFIIHPNAAKILLFILILGGVVGGTSLPQEVFPPFAPPRVDIDIPVRGGTAPDVEELVVKKVEESLDGLAGIERIIANGSANGAQISIELTPEADEQNLLNLIKSRVDGISGFPSIAERPVYSLPESTEPVMFINMVGDVPLTALHNQAMSLRDEMGRLPGVSYVTIANEPEMTLYIDVQPERLSQYDLSLTDISEVIQKYSVNIGGGAVQTLAGRYQLRTDTMGKMANEFDDIPVVSSSTGVVVPLKELATISLQPNDDYIRSSFDGKTSMMLEVYRDKTVSFSEAGGAIKGLIAEKQAVLQPAIELISWRDESREFTSRTSLLIKNGVAGFIIICILMGIFVNIHVAMWTAIGIPVSIIGAMGLIHFTGLDISLNAISLLGFLIALGMIVDDALVIGESIQHETNLKGYTRDAVVSGTNKVAMPATFGVLTTIAAFFPLTLTEGDMGSKLGSVGTVVICCLLVSLVESKFVLPSHLRKPSKFLQHRRFAKLTQLNENATLWLKHIAENRYKPLLLKVIAAPIRSIAIVLCILFGTISFAPLGLVKMAAIPNIADFALSASMQFHPSVAPSIQESIGKKAEESLYKVSDQLKEEYELDYEPVKHVGLDYYNNQLTIDVELAEVFNAPYDAFDVQQLWRDQLPPMVGITSISVDAGSGSGEKIAVEISGENLEDLRSLSLELRQYLSSQDDVVDIRDSEVAASIEYQFKPSPLATSLGVDDRAVISQVRSAFYGSESQRITVGEKEVRVMVRYDKESRESIASLEEMLIPVMNSSTGVKDFIPLNQLVTVEKTVTASEVRRIDKQRTITVYANTKLNTRSPEAVAEDLQDNVLPQLLENYSGITVSLEGEASEANKSISSLISGAGFALFILLSLMSLPIGSFKYSGLILCLIPFGIIGAFWGHAITGFTFSLMSIFGVVALAGVLINNGLLLVDQYLVNRNNNMSLEDGIVESCLRRFRPIVLTSLTTFVGLLPLMWEGDPEALWLIPIAISLGVGLLVATVITMLIFPAFLVLADRNKKFVTEDKASYVGEASEPA